MIARYYVGNQPDRKYTVLMDGVEESEAAHVIAENLTFDEAEATANRLNGTDGPTLRVQLLEARAKVNALDFGTDAWEKAIRIVYRLTRALNAVTEHGRWTSREGEVLA